MMTKSRGLAIKSMTMEFSYLGDPIEFGGVFFVYVLPVLQRFFGLRTLST